MIQFQVPQTAEVDAGVNKWHGAVRNSDFAVVRTTASLIAIW
jgi:hypothetical protein